MIDGRCSQGLRRRKLQVLGRKAGKKKSYLFGVLLTVCGKKLGLEFALKILGSQIKLMIDLKLG